MTEKAKQLGTPKPDLKKPWRNRCSKRCWTSRMKRCRCRCRGFYHGAAVKGKPTLITEYIKASSPASLEQ
jgi:hypothetical protein